MIHKSPLFQKFIITLILLFSIELVFSQSQLKMMQYNLMYYTETSGISDCNATSNNLNSKDANIRAIFHHVMPDVFCVCEIGSSITYVERLLNNAINTDGVDYYRHGPLTNYSGGTIANMIYYDSRKLELYQSYAVSTSYRDINGYTLYYKSTDLAEGDTLFITFWIAHLKAGSSSDNAAARHVQAQRLMEKIKSLGAPGNYVVSGDFNLYGASEPAYQEMINHTNSLYRLYDPINQEGEWNNNSQFAPYHTQSTHAGSADCFASGGLDDRFDFILVSPYVYYGSRDVEVLPSTYYAVGQDGHHFNSSVNTSTNSSVPAEIANALYNQSDHLPVVVDFLLDAQLGISDRSCNYLARIVNPVKENLSVQLQLEEADDYQFSIYSMDGKHIAQHNERLESGVNKLDFPLSVAKGFYILKITNSKHQQQILKIVK